MKLPYSVHVIPFSHWLFIYLFFMKNCYCSMNYSFEKGFGYVPLSPLILNLNDSLKHTVTQIPESVRKIILALDTSESMYVQNRIYKLQHALHHWIPAVPADLLLGLVEFSDFAHPLVEMSPVNPTLKMEFLNAIPKVAEGGSCIGCAVKCAFQMLGTNQEESTVILITDGRNTVPGEDVEDSLSLISGSKIRINIIAIGDAMEDLETLAWHSNGRTYYVPDHQGLLTLSGALFDSLNYVLGGTLKIINIFETELSNEGTEINDNFFVDFTLPATYLSVYFGPETDLNEIELNSSSTHITSEEFEKKDIQKKCFRQILQEGSWKISLKYNLLDKYAAVFVTSDYQHSTSKSNSVVRMRCWHNADVGPVNANIKPIAIYAAIFEGDDAVLGVNLTALLYGPDGTTITVNLWDNASGADDVKNDGTYSQFLPIISVPGRYYLKFQAVGKTRTTRLQQRSIEIQPFSRICRTTSFKITSVPSIYPPVGIYDLKIVKKNKTFVDVCWTAPGSQLDWGQASRYVMKYMRTESCTETFPGNQSAWTIEVISPISPGSSGSAECLCLNYLHYLSLNTCLCLSVYTIVEVGLESPLSNVVEIYCPSSVTAEETVSHVSFSNATKTSSVTTGYITSDLVYSDTINEHTVLPNKSQNASVDNQEYVNVSLPMLITISIVVSATFVLGFFVLIKFNIIPNVCSFHSYNIYRQSNNQRGPPIVIYTSLDSITR